MQCAEEAVAEGGGRHEAWGCQRLQQFYRARAAGREVRLSAPLHDVTVPVPLALVQLVLFLVDDVVGPPLCLQILPQCQVLPKDDRMHASQIIAPRKAGIIENWLRCQS